MKKIHVTKKKLAIALCVAIPVAVAAVVIPKVIKDTKPGKRVCV
ncbi:MAG: hypothetical protein PHE09_00355 [Oscillospiraceae bacterium]|nr:hypothetical protein [Oscillospiraceae bacterium]